MPVTIQSPLQGVCKLHTPSGHHPYSKDFQCLDFRGRALTPGQWLLYLLARLDATSLPSWGQEVRAPLAGKILVVAQDQADRYQLNGLLDRMRKRFKRAKAGEGAEFFLGNYLILEAESGHHLLFAHLQKSSVRVVEGQSVAVGEVLARIGNSGQSLQPHLHFHITDPTSSEPDQPRPFVLNQFQTLADGIWRDHRESLPPDDKPFRTIFDI